MCSIYMKNKYTYVAQAFPLLLTHVKTMYIIFLVLGFNNKRYYFDTWLLSQYNLC